MSQSQNVLDWQRVRANFTSVNVLMWLSSTSDHIDLLWIQALSYDGHDKHILCPQREAFIVIKLPVLSVLSVWVFISYPEYISYIILSRNAKFMS